MQTVSLFDTVTVSLLKNNYFGCKSDVDTIPSGDENIAQRAAKLFFESTGINGGADIFIEKRIPVAAGLAGGSTDAAAVLVALNKLTGYPVDRSVLLNLASRLGADVPFCVECGCAYSDGKGDVLHEFPSIPTNTVFVVACGGESVSTPWAYRTMDKKYNDFLQYVPQGTDELKNALLSDDKNNFKNHIFNLFESAVLPERGVAVLIKETMLSTGAQAAMMSGSGPSVFGIFEDVMTAQKAKEAINSLGYFAFVCYPVGNREDKI